MRNFLDFNNSKIKELLNFKFTDGTFSIYGHKRFGCGNWAELLKLWHLDDRQ